MSSIHVCSWEPDKQKALAVVRAIKNAGIEADCGPSQLASDADCVVMLWSAAAQESADVQEALSLALKAWSKGLLVLAVLDDTPLPLGLRDLPKNDLRDFTEKNLDNIVRDVLAAVHDAKGPVHAPAPPAMQSPPPPASRTRSWIGLGSILLVAVLMIGAGSLLFFQISVQPTETPEPSVHHEHRRPGPRPQEPEALPPDANGLSNGTAITLTAIAVLSLLSLMAALIARRRWSHKATPDTVDLREQHSGKSGLSISVVQSGSDPGVLDTRSAQVFVSYSTLDIGSVEQIISLIEKAGQHIWIDRNAAGSARYAAKISYAIRNARVVALMCSKTAFQSDHVIREIYLAADFKKPFIAFMLDTSDIPDEAQYFLTGFPRIPIAGLNAVQLSSRIEQVLHT